MGVRARTAHLVWSLTSVGGKPGSSIGARNMDVGKCERKTPTPDATNRQRERTRRSEKRKIQGTGMSAALFLSAGRRGGVPYPCLLMRGRCSLSLSVSERSLLLRLRPFEGCHTGIVPYPCLVCEKQEGNAVRSYLSQVSTRSTFKNKKRGKKKKRGPNFFNAPETGPKIDFLHTQFLAFGALSPPVEQAGLVHHAFRDCTSIVHSDTVF